MVAKSCFGRQAALVRAWLCIYSNSTLAHCRPNLSSDLERERVCLLAQCCQEGDDSVEDLQQHISGKGSPHAVCLHSRRGCHLCMFLPASQHAAAVRIPVSPGGPFF